MILILGVIVLTGLIISLSFITKGSEESHIQNIVKQYDLLRKNIIKTFKEKGELPSSLMEVQNINELNLSYPFKLDKNGKFILLTVEQESLAKGVLEKVSDLSYYEKPMLYLSIYGKSNIVEPIVEIKVSPDNITTTSHIKYNYKEVSKENHKIVEEVWQGNKDCFPSAGEYEVTLKVKNSQNIWSEEAKKIISVTEEPGIKTIVSSPKILFIIYNNGQVKYQAYSTNKLKLPVTEEFAIYDSLEGVLDISMNYDHALMQINDRTIKAAGSNGYGQLALNTKIDKANFSKIWGLENVRSIQTGDKISAAMTKGGLYLWGKNDEKQIAFTTQVYYDMPQKFNQLNDVKDYSVGKDHILFKTKSGKVFAQGCNDYGQLGNGYSDNVLEIQEVLLLNAELIHAGDEFSFAVTEEGKLYGWGKNNYYQLGMQGARVKTPIIINDIKDIIYITSSEKIVVVVTEKGEIYTWGTYISGTEAIDFIDPHIVKGADSVKSITICDNKIFVLTIDDALYVADHHLKLEKVDIN